MDSKPAKREATRRVAEGEQAMTELHLETTEATTPETEDRCVEALRFKCDVLWCILDATALASGVFK